MRADRPRWRPVAGSMAPRKYSCAPPMVETIVRAHSLSPCRCPLVDRARILGERTSRRTLTRGPTKLASMTLDVVVCRAARSIYRG